MMDRVRAFLGQVVSLFRGRRARAELREEFEHHLEMETRANLREGMTPAEARRRALLAFGGADWYGERVRDQQWGWLRDLSGDVRLGLRQLGRRPAFAAAATLTLAIGIGMSTAMFALVDAVLFRPLQGSNTEGLVYLSVESDDGEIGLSPTPEVLRLVRDYATSFTDVEAFSVEELTLEIAGERLRGRGGRASVGFFSALGVRPERGRTFVPADGEGGGSLVALSSHALWQERFAGTAGAANPTVRVDGRIYEVVGVLPRTFRLETPRQPILWIPEGAGGDAFADGTPVEGALARLREGVSIEAARDELSALVEGHPLASVAERRMVGRIDTPADRVDPALTRAILIFQVAAVLVLLVGCVNLANLLLAQGESRRKELALRASLGAGRGRLVRQMLSESLVLGVLGGAVGLALALWALGALPRFLPAGYEGFTPSATVFLVAIGLSLGSVLAIGLVPALRSANGDLGAIMKGGGSGGLQASRPARLPQLLVAGEVALTVLLLVGAGLLLKSYAGLSTMDLGFDRDRLVALWIELPEERYDGPEARELFIDRLRAGLERALPAAGANGTVASGFVEHLNATAAPLSTDLTPESDETPSLKFAWRVAPGFFATVGQSVLRGREPGETVDAGDEPPVVVNEVVARRYFPDGDAVDRRLKVGSRWYRVVGVVVGLRLPGLAKSGAGDQQLFLPLTPYSQPGLTILVRTGADPAAAIDLAKGAVREIDPTIPLADVASVEQQLGDSVAQDASNSILMVVFAVTALLLGAVGVYGIVSYAVGHRRREMGIRMAMGASSAEVLRRFLTGGLTPVIAGMVLGTAGAIALGTTFARLLHEVDPRDPGVYLAVLSTTAVVALLSTWLPARRSSRLDPVATLKSE